MSELHEVKGVLHVHTAYSDSSGRMPYVLDCAKETGLDYVVVSDHGTLEAKREGWEGWHDGVLLVVGVDVTACRGHSLVLGLDRCRDWFDAHPNEYLPEVERLGGRAFIAHPERNDRGKLYQEPQAWPDLATDAYAGVEIWSYVHDWIDWAYPFHILAGVRDPDRGIAGPHPAVLRAWDRVARRRHVAGIGALDAHELRLPIPKLRWALLKVLPLAFLCRTVRTHVFVSEPLDGPDGVATLTEALVAGRAFVAYDLLGDATGTRFVARRGGEEIHLGDEVAAGGELAFRASVPLDAELRLLRDGEVVAERRAAELAHRDVRPGVYRFEARLGGRPWVFTNHIYVR
jgi:hypothetical protein